VLFLLRRNLGALIDRASEFKAFGVETKLTPQLSQREQIDTEKIDSGVRPVGRQDAIAGAPPNSPLYEPFELHAREAFMSRYPDDPELRFAWVLRLYAETHVLRMHESSYRVIFGSQIQALRHLNLVRSVPQTGLREFYDKAKAVNPLIYVKITFQTWCDFLAAQGYVTIASDAEQVVTITVLGQDFLLWMTRVSAPDNKLG
jgi:hypothetical protein